MSINGHSGSPDVHGSVKHPAVRGAIRNAWLSLGLIGFVFVFFLLNDWQVNDRAKQTEQTIARLSATVEAMATPQPMATQQKDFSFPYEYKPDGTLVFSTPQPVASPATSQHYTVTTYYSGYNLGNGSYLLKMKADPDPSGKYNTLEEAQGYISGSIAVIESACPSSPSKEEGYLSFFESYNTQKRVTPECWSTLYDLTGQPPKNHLPPEKVTYLQNNVGLGLTEWDINLFFDDNGYLIGHWRNSPLPGPNTKQCLDQSLQVIGWRGQTGYFVVGRHAAWDTIYNEALAAIGPKIPDLCDTANLKSVIRPNWLDSSWQNGIYTIKTVNPAHPLTVKVHTGLSAEDPYPDGVEQGRYLVEVDGKSFKATIGDRDLVAIDEYLGQDANSNANLAVYFSLDHGQLVWFMGQSTDWPQVLDVAVLVISPWIDGTAPWIDYGHGTYYSLDDNVVKQNPAKEWKTQ